LTPFGQQAVHVDEALDRAEQAVLQARLVGAAGDRGDQVDVALADRVALFGEGDAPRGALALGDVLALLAVGEVRALEQRDQRVGGQRLHQVVGKARLVEPVVPLGLGLARLLDRERDLHPGHQHRLAAQEVHELGPRQLDALEVARVGPDADRRAALALAGAGLLHHERHGDVAAGEADRRDLAAAPDRDVEALRERIGDADADAVQAAREAVGAAGALVELAAGVQRVKTISTTLTPSSGCRPNGMPRPSSSTLTEPSPCSVTSIALASPPSASSAALSITSCTMCSGLSVRVYMPGRCFTGSSPFSTLIDASP
jgi:hypothetical protein